MRGLHKAENKGLPSLGGLIDKHTQTQSNLSCLEYSVMEHILVPRTVYSVQLGQLVRRGHSQPIDKGQA